MTNDMLQQLIQSINAPKPTANGSFAKCTARFNGIGDAQAFVDNISTYKTYMAISDDNALLGMSTLLEKQAAIWWLGIKRTVASWQDATTMLLKEFGATKPPHQIFREIFEREQCETDPTELFIAEKRALLDRIEDEISETVQLHMIYGLLHRRVRNKIPRTAFATFIELQQELRKIEEVDLPRAKPTTPAHTLNASKIPSCVFCKHIGHTMKECRKKKSSAAHTRNSSKRPRCGFCKYMGHKKEECRKKKRAEEAVSTRPPTQRMSTTLRNPDTTPLVCFGCGKQGIISECPNCRENASGAHLDFFLTSTVSLAASRIRPIVNIDVAGATGSAYMDTGARQCIAGYTLYQVLRAANRPFGSREVNLVMADGKPRPTTVLTTTVPVRLMDRTIVTEFLVLPEAKNHTLLGVDFIEDANITLNIPEKYWSFNADSRKFEFAPEPAQQFFRSYSLREIALPAQTPPNPPTGDPRSARYQEIRLFGRIPSSSVTAPATVVAHLASGHRL